MQGSMLFSRLILRLPTRPRLRSLTYFLGILLCFVAIFHVLFGLPGGAAGSSRLSRYPGTHHLKDSFGTKVLNPFRAPVRPPSQQETGSSRDSSRNSSWWNDWKWRLSFSSSVVSDEDTALLPPLAPRPPIYCYYAGTAKGDETVEAAESDLLLTWQRAWWAKGFKPVILGASEALGNPTYRKLQLREDEMSDAMTADAMRWLAWDTVGGGLLADYTLLPMGSWQDALLGSLRRGNYSGITMWEGLGNGLLAGQKASVSVALDAVLEKTSMKNTASVVTMAPKELVRVDKTPARSLAYYSSKTLEEKYSTIATLAEGDRVAGLKRLNELENAHLHIAWRHTFSSGISVIKPKPAHTTKLAEPAMNLAKTLARCPRSLLASHCPPNMPECRPCDPTAGDGDWIRTLPALVNDTSLFVIGTAAHPHTFAMLTERREELPIAWIRRDSSRDPWISLVTQGLAVGNARVPPLVLFKEAAAGTDAASLSLWLVAEEERPEDLEWYFGFALPAGPVAEEEAGKSKQQEELVRREHDDATQTADGLQSEHELLESAKAQLVSRDARVVAARGAMEAWNAADMEAWRFAKALLGQRATERMGWLRDEGL